MGLLFIFELAVRQQLKSDFKNFKFFPTFGPMEFLQMVSIVAKSFDCDELHVKIDETFLGGWRKNNVPLWKNDFSTKG